MRKAEIAADPTNEWARGIERALRAEAILFEELQDDHVVEPVINVGWKVSVSHFGVEAVVHQGGDAEHMKDVHTLNNEPGRLARWVRIAREEIGE